MPRNTAVACVAPPVLCRADGGQDTGPAGRHRSARDRYAGRGRRRSEIGAEENVERLVYAIVNEGARILEEGIAYRGGDIDVVWTAGYDFPDHCGGPMQYADERGLTHIVARLDHYAATRGNPHGDWTVSPL